MRTRGWPRLAEQEAAIAATLDPESLATQIMLAEAALSRNRLEEAQAAADRLMVLAPEDHRVQRLSREVAAARGWSIEADLGPTWNEGGGTNAPGDEWTSSLRVESPRFARALRLFALADASIAHPIEGRVSRYRAGGGIAFQGIDLAARFTAHRPGARCRAVVPGSRSTGRRATSSRSACPARSSRARRRFGPCSMGSRRTRSRPHSGGAGMRQHPLRWRRAGSPFRTGTIRLSAAIVRAQRLWAGPHVDVTGRAGIWYTHNSQPGGPYFSPDWVVSGTAGAHRPAHRVAALREDLLSRAQRGIRISGPKRLFDRLDRRRQLRASLADRSLVGDLLFGDVRSPGLRWRARTRHWRAARFQVEALTMRALTSIRRTGHRELSSSACSARPAGRLPRSSHSSTPASLPSPSTTWSIRASRPTSTASAWTGLSPSLTG